MINKKSRTIEWITDIAKQLKIHDIALAEKTIRAFSLLEALALSNADIKRHLEGKTVRKVIAIVNRIVNIVAN
jgi:leucyl-tRNA synthetase